MTMSVADLTTFFSLAQLPRGAAEALSARYNIAPTQNIATVKASSGQRQLVWMRWGLMPPWYKHPADGPLLINARAESADQKRSFKGALSKRRCVIPADGYIEWKTTPCNKKQPYLFRPASGEPISFAGLWETWEPSSQSEPTEPVNTCALLTTEASEDVAPIHHRMPLLVPHGRLDSWLDAQNDARSLIQALEGDPAKLIATPINRRVNDARHDDPTCHAPPDLHPTTKSPQSQLKLL